LVLRTSAHIARTPNKVITSFSTISFLSTIYFYTIIFSPENSSSGVERMKKDKVRLLCYKYFPKIK
jgi:hypothetical protein